MSHAFTRLWVVVAFATVFLCPQGTCAVLSGTSLATVPTTVVRFGPAGNDGCGSGGAGQLELFEVPVITNFPLPQFYCGLLVTPIPGEPYRIVSDGGWVLCVDTGTMQHIAWWAPATTSNHLCVWVVGQQNVAWCGDESVKLELADDGTYRVGLEYHGVAISNPPTSPGVELVVGGGVAGAGRSFWSGGRASARSLGLRVDARRFVAVGAIYPGTGISWLEDPFDYKRVCNLQQVVDIPNVGWPKAVWALSFTLQMSSTVVAGPPKVVMYAGGGGVGITIWCDYRESVVVLIARWSPSGDTRVAKGIPTGRSNWVFTSNGTMARDGVATRGEATSGIFADGDNDDFLQGRGPLLVGFFPAARVAIMSNW